MKLVAALLAAAAIAFTAGACSPKASEEECRAAADHVVDLTVAAFTKSNPGATEEAVAAARERAEKGRNRFVTLCSKLDRVTVICIGGAGTLEATQKCDTSPK